MDTDFNLDDEDEEPTKLEKKAKKVAQKIRNNDLPELPDEKPYYEEPTRLKITRRGDNVRVFLMILWTIIGIMLLIGAGFGGYYAYKNHWSLSGIITINNQYTIPVNNTNYNFNNISIDPSETKVNPTINIYNHINNTNQS